jgi:RNA polymerase sigma factor (TIGR02999 family)
MNTTPPPAAVTQLLIRWGDGDHAALGEIWPLVYEELRRLAAYYMDRERSGHTLQPTALVHETYLRLVDQRQINWKNRAQFFGLAAEMMRRILVNHARDRRAAKRGGAAERVSLSVAVNSFERPDVNLLALDEALDQLATLDARKSRIVELKFFGGLTTTEIAELLQVSTATIEREWSLARAWLYRAVTSDK